MQTNIPMGDLPGWALPVIVALAAVQLAVEVYALVVMLRTPLERLVFGKRWPWVVRDHPVREPGWGDHLPRGRTQAVAGCRPACRPHA